MGLPSHQDHKAQSNSAAAYMRHRPETTLLYQIVHEYWPEFQAELAIHGTDWCGDPNPEIWWALNLKYSLSK